MKQWLTVQLAVFAACGGADVAELAAGARNQERSPADPGRRPRLSAGDLGFLQGQGAIARSVPHDRSSRIRRIARHRATWSPISSPMQSSSIRRVPRRAPSWPTSLLASVHEITQELLGYIANLEDTAAGWTSTFSTRRSASSNCRRQTSSPRLSCGRLWPCALRYRLCRHSREARRFVARWHAAAKSDHFQSHRRCFAAAGHRALDDRRPDGE